MLFGMFRSVGSLGRGSCELFLKVIMFKILGSFDRQVVDVLRLITVLFLYVVLVVYGDVSS